MKQVDEFKTIVSNACKDGVYTYESLKTSSYYSDFFVAANNLANKIATLNEKFTRKACHFRAEDIDDVIENLTLTILFKYTNIANAYLNPKQECNGTYKPLNFNSYITNIFRSMIYDFLKPYELKETKIEPDDITGKLRKKTQPVKVKDELGNESKVYIYQHSFNKPIDDDNDSSCVADCIPSDKTEWAPEEAYITAEEYNEALTMLLNITNNIASRHKYKFQTWVLISNILKYLEVEPCLSKALKTTGEVDNLDDLENLRKYTVECFNADIDQLTYCLSSTIDKSLLNQICDLKISSYIELGRNFRLSNENYYRAKNRNKKEINEYYDPKKRR